MRNRALKKAIAAAGSLSKLGEILNVTKQAVGAWQRCPPHHVLKIERATGVSRHDLRPDLYPREK